jgi:hypothetical protein
MLILSFRAISHYTANRCKNLENCSARYPHSDLCSVYLFNMAAARKRLCRLTICSYESAVALPRGLLSQHRSDLCAFGEPSSPFSKPRGLLLQQRGSPRMFTSAHRPAYQSAYRALCFSSRRITYLFLPVWLSRMGCPRQFGLFNLSSPRNRSDYHA